MKLGEIYEFFVREGINAELRTQKQVQKQLSKAKDIYRSLKKSEKKFFDIETLTNPYSDSRILYGDRNKKINRILIGIDIEVSEVLLAAHLNQQGQEIDLIISHHPKGTACAGLYEVMIVQIDLLSNLGIPYHIAKDIMDKRIQEVARRLHSSNHSRTIDAARLLNIPIMCCHTPADNHVASYLYDLVKKQSPMTLKKCVDLLSKEPEYKEAKKNKLGPQILVGKSQDKVGKFFVDMTGGTEGSKDVFARVSQLGVNTIINMHLSEQHFLRVKNEYINIVNAGHIASDNLGVNLLLDKLEKQNHFEFIECSGFRRFKRHGRDTQ